MISLATQLITVLTGVVRDMFSHVNPTRIRVTKGLAQAFAGLAIGLAMTYSPPPCDAEAPSYGFLPDVVYGHKAGMALTYDVIQPKADSNGAAVVFMMSGGWVSGWVNPASFVGEAVPDGFRHFRDLVDKGYALVIVRHGSSPYFKVPDAVADVRLALRHLKSNAKEYGIDAGRIGVCGASAGGHLSLMLGLSPRGGEPEKEAADYEQVAAVVAYFPPVDIREIVGPSKNFPALDFDPELAAEVSPIRYVTSDDPPTLLIHGDADKLVDVKNSQVIFEALQEKNVPSELIVIAGAAHGFTGASALKASAALVAWFDKYLAKPTNDRTEESEASDRE